MKIRFLFIIIILVVACESHDKFDPSLHYDLNQQDQILSRIIAHIYTPPPYVSNIDRLKAEHKNYYLSLTSKFSWLSLHIKSNGTHYFLVERPGSGPNHRVVGGSFNLNADSLVNFREMFVTPALPDSILKTRSKFLFSEWMNGNVQPYLSMPTYVQWPNDASIYDTLTFEWRLKPEVVYDSVSSRQE